MDEYEYNGWDYGPGNQDDFAPSAGDFGPPQDFQQDEWYSGTPLNSLSPTWEQPQSFDPTFGLESGGFFGGQQTMAPPEWGQQSFEMSPEELQAAGSMPSITNWNTNTRMPQTTQGQQGWSLGGVSNLLAQLFTQQQGNRSVASPLAKLIGGGVSAAAAGKQNNQLASQIPQAVQQSRQAQSPFDYGAQPNGPRAAAQAEYLKALQNPYGSQIVSQQADALAKAQAIKDAAAGRRSNNATSSPALVAAQAQIAQNYLNSMAEQSGSKFNPSGSGLEQLVQALKAGTEGYMSPMSRALGDVLGTNYTQNKIDGYSDILAQWIGAMQQRSA